METEAGGGLFRPARPAKLGVELMEQPPLSLPQRSLQMSLEHLSISNKIQP